MKKIRAEAYPIKDYPQDAEVVFPESIHLAFAVCSRECGSRQVIVDGGTQICEYCGKQMFRLESRLYRLTDSTKAG